ncbi:plasmalemma vesicle associated protein a [Cololabis saira]|uniref:plasmalemma vesicle associated protein a n=1 Tax=Cololabis saira TaxID=129043 RepID=UPI002AD550E2|nr:plasmalemma vesicle associated protein a [Cololabis saira]
MYSSGYSQVNKFTPRAQKKMKYHSKGKSCGYYMRIVFFFSSLIQSLIIVSLVLFLIYGKTQDSASVTRVQDLEERFSRVSLENVALREQRKNLTNLLNTTLVEKARNDWDLNQLRHLSNVSLVMIQDFQRTLIQCKNDVMSCKFRFDGPQVAQAFSPGGCPCNCGYLERENAKLELLRSNFTQTTKLMRMEMDQILKERDNCSLGSIHLRRDKSILQMELQSYKNEAKQDFQHSLTTVTNVSRAFLEKIDSLFPRHLAFQLTCAKQREHLDQIRTNCTNLSREVEDKLQRYLNIVGDQVSSIQAENNHLKAENSLLSLDYRQCSQNRMSLIRDYKQNREELQKKHDQEKEKLFMDKLKLDADIDVLTKTVKYKSKEVDHLAERLKQLNMSCTLKGFGGQGQGLRPNTQYQPGGGGFGGGLNYNPLGRPNSGGLGPNFGTGSAFNKPAAGFGASSYLPSGSSSSQSNTGYGLNKPGSTGTGSSSSYLPSGSSSSQSNTGYGLNKPGLTGTGSSSSYLPSGSSSSQSNTGYGVNKPSTGTGSSSSYLPSGSSSSQSNTGYGVNKPSTGTGSSSSYLPSGSSSSQSNTGYGVNKPSTGTGSSSSYLPSGSSSSQSNTGYGVNKPGSTGGVGSSSGSSKPGLLGRGSTAGSSSSSGSTSKSGSPSSGYNFFGVGSSKSDPSKTVPQKPSSGSTYGGTGSSLGGGRTSGVAAASGSISQHIRDLQRIINPSSPQEKQELSRMLG